MVFARTVVMVALAWAAGLASHVVAAAEIETGPVPPARAGVPPAEDFFKAAQYKNVQLSPDGRRLAALVPINGRANLALVDLEHKKVIALTGRTSDDVSSYRWLGDRVIEARIADLDEAGGVLHEHNHTLIDVVDQVELRDLHTISRFGNATIIEALDADGTDLIVETHDRSSSSFTNRAIVYGGYDAYRYNARTGKKQLLTHESPGDVGEFISDHEGQVRIAVSTPRDGERFVVSYRRSNDDKWTTLRDDPVDEPSLEPIAFDDDNRTLYVRVPDKQRKGMRDVYAFDTETGQLGQKIFVAAEVDAGGVVLDRVQHKVVGVRDGSPAGIAWIDPRWNAVQKAIDAALPGAHNHLQWARNATDRVIVMSETEVLPPIYYMLDRKTMQMERVAQSRPWLGQAELSPRRAVSYNARDGLRIPAYLTLPKHPDGAKPPLIVDIHGGPYVSGAHFGFDADAQFFASRGYATLQPNFRGTTGYGDAFEKAGFRQWGLAMQDDVTDGVKWLIATGQVDADRICLYGASYGGYATLWGLEKEPDLFRCGIAFLAVSDLELLIDVNWSDTNGFDVGGASLAYYKRTIGDPATDREKMRAVSPIRHADRIRAPLLLAYGSSDQRVPLVHGNEMRSALERADKPYEWVVYSDQQHQYFSPENRDDFYRRVDAFLLKYVAPRDTTAATKALTSADASVARSPAEAATTVVQ